MGLLTNKLGIRALSMEDPSQPLLPYSYLFESLGLGKSDAGVLVNEKQAMRLTTAFACIMIISEDLSSLPLPIYQKMPDGSSREATEHPYFGLFNANMVLRGAWLAGALGWGNGYALIRRDRGATAKSLQVLPSDKTAPVLVDGVLKFATTYTETGQVAYIEPENMLHLPGLTLDGVTGLSPIQTCKNAFGLAIATEKFGAQFFGNGARTSGVLSHPEQLEGEAYENLKKSVRERISGENALMPLILEEGMTWTQASVSPNDAQFLETRKFQRSEIASLYRVAMHLLQDLERSTNNNIEHQSLDHIRYCLRPWAVRIEQEAGRKLLGPGYYIEHDMNAFQRGDFASQTAGFTLLRNAGVYSANDILRALRQNPIPEDEGGDIRLAPLNMVPLTSLVGQNSGQNDDNSAVGPDATATDRRRGPIVNAYRRLFRDAVGRVLNRKNADSAFVYRAFQPVLASMGLAIIAMYLPATEKLSDDEEMAVGKHANAIAAAATGWTKEMSSATATQLTDEAYTALHAALIG